MLNIECPNNMATSRVFPSNRSKINRLTASVLNVMYKQWSFDARERDSDLDKNKSILDHA